MEELMIETKNLSKKYKDTLAVDNVNIHIKRGAIYGLIGMNGAGKTTIMRMIAGLAKPTEGEVTFPGFAGDLKEIYSRIGCLIESPSIQPNFTAYQNMKMKCLACGMGNKEYIMDKLKLVGLANTGRKKAGKFSLGMKQRLGIALALVGEPDFLLLDEPINGLDPQGIVEVRELMSKLSKETGVTIIVSSHILDELSKIATDYAIIHKGRIIEESTREELELKCKDRIVIKALEHEKILPILDREGFGNYKVVDPETIYVFDRLEDLSLLNKTLVNEDIVINSIGIVALDLEEYFLNVTGTTKG